MARREIFVDDLDGKEADDVETRRFSIGRQGYSIDLSSTNYEAFLKDVDKYVSVATKEEAPSRAVTGPRPARTARTATTTGEPSRASQIRAWAASEGIAVAERGRIHKDVVEKYDYAMEADKK